MWALAVWIVYFWLWAMALVLGLMLLFGIIYVVVSVIYGAAMLAGLTAVAPVAGSTALYRWAKRLKSEPKYRRVIVQRWRIGLFWSTGYLGLLMLTLASKRLFPRETWEALW